MLNYSFQIKLKKQSEVNDAITDIFYFLHFLDGNLSHVECFLVECTIMVAIRIKEYKQGDDDMPPLVAFHHLLQQRLSKRECSKLSCWDESKKKSELKKLRDDVKLKKGHTIFSLGKAFPYSFCERLGMQTLAEAVKGENGADIMVTLFNKCANIVAQDS